MTDEALTLRTPFPAAVVGKLPKLTCKSCSNSNTKVCQEHRKQKCNTCGNYISTAHIDLVYVGHAAVTDRLLSIDPTWTWEPVGTDALGLPALDKDGGLWIRLTVNGVTRLGYGDGPDNKQRIGDAIRNAAMRFGVALDLWSKEELESEVSAGGSPSTNGHGHAPSADSSSGGEPVPDPQPRESAPPAGVPLDALDKLKAQNLADRLNSNPELRGRFIVAKKKIGLKDGDDDFQRKAHDLLDRLEAGAV